MSYKDILGLDAKIRKSFEQENDNLPIYRKNLLDLQKTSKTHLSPHVRQNLNKNIQMLEERIHKIETCETMNFYISETAHLLEKYRVILSTPIKMSFVGKSVKNIKEKDKIVYNYLTIAQRYTDIEIENLPRRSKVWCNNCDNKKSFDVIDNSIYICMICGSQQEVILHTSSYKDIDRINMSQKYTYDRRVHFRDCIKQYQGKQNSTIDDKVFVKLEDEFDKHHLLVGNKDASNEVKFQNITKEHIHLFLKELGYTKHYENVNLIHYQLTGIKPDDISYLEDRLLDDFDLLTDLYDKKFKNKAGFDRKNFINTQYVLYQLLMKYKHPCNKDNFTILKTVDRKSFHDDVCKVCFENLGWNHEALF